MSKKYWNLAHQSREKRKPLDKVVIWIFAAVFNRWISKHLSVAYGAGEICSRELHSLDAQMKSDLERPGFRKPEFGGTYGNA